MADTYVVERSLTIKAPAERIFEKISNFRNWGEWSPWEDLDPDLEKTFSGDDGAVGSTYGWRGNRKAGQGTMTMSALDAPNSVSVDLEFLKPFKSHSTSGFALASDGESTMVTWTMTGTHNWVSKIMGIFMKMDKMIGKDFEKGLQNLKEISED